MLLNDAMASSENEGLKICGIRRKPEFSSPSGFEAFRNGGALGAAVRFLGGIPKPVALGRADTVDRCHGA
jgi:hypothetical protein